MIYNILSITMPQISLRDKMKMPLQERVLRPENKAIALSTEKEATPRTMSGIRFAKDWKDQPSLRTWLMQFGYLKQTLTIYRWRD